MAKRKSAPKPTGRAERFGSRDVEKIRRGKVAMQAIANHLGALLDGMKDQHLSEVEIDGINRLDRAIKDGLGWVDDALDYVRRKRRDRDLGLSE